MNSINKIILLGFILSAGFSAYSKNSDKISEHLNEKGNYSDWTKETHSDSIDPNYNVVFDNTSVMCMEIVIDSSKWKSMQSNLVSIFGNHSDMIPRNGNHPDGPPRFGNHPDGPPGFGNQPDMPPGIGGDRFNNNTEYKQNTKYDKQKWQDCSIYYYTSTDTIEWYHVGVRYKGNSSLQRSYESGSSKISFKLDFDQYEEDYPDLKNQRFYGFKQLNLSNNFDDNSCLREKVIADLFRSFGVPAAHTRFCALFVDHGEGKEFYGVYTIVEEVDDTVLKDQFRNNDGNLYKPDGDAASFGEGTFDKDEFVKKNNEDKNDYTDVLNLYDVLNNENDTRTTDTALWCSNLEKVLNVPEFLKWLAANTVIQNWDTYGNMTHNYYLYNNEDTGLLNWIPWDNNEAFSNKGNRALSLSLSKVSKFWPLINYLMKIDKYKNEYKKNLQKFVDEIYNSTSMNLLYDKYYTLLNKYASKEGNYQFSKAVSNLKRHVSSREKAVENYLTK